MELAAVLSSSKITNFVNCTFGTNHLRMHMSRYQNAHISYLEHGSPLDSVFSYSLVRPDLHKLCNHGKAVTLDLTYALRE